MKTENKAYKIFDGGGLFIYVTATGNKKWRIKYRFEGKENTLSIGDHPLISLRDARAKLQKVKGML